VERAVAVHGGGRRSSSGIHWRPGIIVTAEEALERDPAGARLTPRELEVLAAMADGASNKAIARRLEISFHTAKFHVAAILAKLDADSRTEAVTRAAQLGLVML
jgi:DNA-binding NarL/FixJ family response regulator